MSSLRIIPICRPVTTSLLTSVIPFRRIPQCSSLTFSSTPLRNDAALFSSCPTTLSSSQNKNVNLQQKVQEFNDIVNMTAPELEKWLKSESSEEAGAGGESGETVGHESGRKIVDILKRNPNKEEDKYTDEDLQHMRKVVSYCKRHLAQEASMKERKSKEEMEQTKSVRSLKSEWRMRTQRQHDKNLSRIQG